MKPSLLDGIEQIIKADRVASKEMLRDAQAMIDAMKKQRATFDSKKEKIKEEMNRGARLTKHRISL